MAGEEIGYASMPVIPTFKGLARDLERGTSKAMASAGSEGGQKFGKAASDSARSKFKSTAKNIVAPILGVFAAAKVGDFFKDAIQGASDLNESTNKVQQVFGKGTGQIFKFSANAAKSLGQTNQEARDAASTFGIFGRAAKLSDKQNAKFAIRMDKLASDLASFHNTSPEQAIEAIGAAMRGEQEPIRAYGVLLDEATLKAEALRLGLLKPVKDKSKILGAQARLADAQNKYNESLKKNGKNSLDTLKAQGQLGFAQSSLQKATEGTLPPLTQQQKILAAQSSILKQTKVAQGDFARTSGGLANQQRILSARWHDAKTALGTALLPTVNNAVKFLNDKGIPAFERFADFFTKKGVPAIKRFADRAKPLIEDVLTKARDILKDAQPYAEGFVRAFNKLPKGVKTGIGAAALLGFGASKVPGVKGLLGGGGGAAKGILGLVTKAKPLPVFVVNNGGGLGGGKPKPTGIGGKVVPATKLFGPAAVIAAGEAATHHVNVGKHKAFTESEFSSVHMSSQGAGVMGSPFKPSDFLEQGSNFGKAFDRAAKAAGKTVADTATLVNELGKTKAGAKALSDQVNRSRDGVKATRAQAKALNDLLVEAARRIHDNQVRLEHNITSARQANNDARLARGGIQIVHNGDIRSDSPRDYVRNAQKTSRHRAGGGRMP